MTIPDEPAAGGNVAESTFATHRGLLFNLAYDLVGSVADAEDVVQETWLQWAAADHERVLNPRAYLTRILTRQAMRHLRLKRGAREDYVGPWLPEPVRTAPDPADNLLRAHTISLGLMVVLETLSPLERAAFVLHEAFGYNHGDIARILDRSPAAVRQLVHRAREHVQARRPRFPAGRAAAQTAAERFVKASLGGSLTGLLEVLAPDVTLWTDGGGRVSAALQPIHGNDKVARFCVAVMVRYSGITMRWLEDTDTPTALLLSNGMPFAVFAAKMDASGERFQEIYGILNPDKLAHLASSPMTHAE